LKEESSWLRDKLVRWTDKDKIWKDEMHANLRNDQHLQRIEEMNQEQMESLEIKREE